ncbi:hypothetical protein ANN_13241 [Periplaneta americana]|uniref:Uncharacterized protein n=1 Tax=Periplaneta americana TaxID=6978 RepID=A0ABQ8TJ01_PERAM|nr:hypothetical protein ANN_13241 [Periplaneta americana]
MIDTKYLKNAGLQTTILRVQFKVCHGSLYAVMWLAEEPREFNFPTPPQLRCYTKCSRDEPLTHCDDDDDYDDDDDNTETVIHSFTSTLYILRTLKDEEYHLSFYLLGRDGSSLAHCVALTACSSGRYSLLTTDARSSLGISKLHSYSETALGAGLNPDSDDYEVRFFEVSPTVRRKSGIPTAILRLILPKYYLADDNNALSESAMRISYKICHKTAKELKTFNEGEFIKRCLIILADELCPQQVGEVEAICLSRRTVVRRLHLLSKNVKVRIYRTVILPVVLYGCETWTLTLREEHRLRVFENKVLRKIFGAKRVEVTGEWRKLHNTELHAL